MEYSKLDDDNLLPKKTITSYGKRYGKRIVFCLLGGLIGGPIGLLLSHAIHAGIGITSLIEVITIVGGITTGNIVNNRYKADKIRYIGKPSPSSYQILTGCFMDQSENTVDTDGIITLQTKLNLFASLLEQDHWFKKWYENLITTYYKKTETYDKIKLIRITLDTMVRDIIKMLLEYPYHKIMLAEDSDTLKPDVVITIYTVSEAVLMMSLYQHIYKIAQVKNQTMDRKYQKKILIYQPEIETSSNIINCLNTLVDKKTASQKVAVLLKTCTLIADQKFIGCDCLLIAFVSNLSKSNIRHPFTEFQIIDELLPEGLKGKEAYALSTFSASCHYLANYNYDQL